MMPRTGTIQSSRLLSGALLCALLLLLSSVAAAEVVDAESEEELSPRALRDFYPKGPNLTSEKQLLGALQEVLEKLQAKRLPMWEKKFGQVPTVHIYISYILMHAVLIDACIGRRNDRSVASPSV
uniref:Cocaine- and amphetamine-regulated transcript protein-like n=1 Tax=Sparus aurata TaxID=8175 RepID=A0A671W962_SPAAU